MTYAVKEIFKTIQGEGHHAGRVAVFCRFAGCNLWSGREEDRASAVCKFCDTDFVGGTKYETAEKLAREIEATWGLSSNRDRMVVLTGGEPALQYDARLEQELRRRNFYIAIETNGTVPIEGFPDWICLSPKANTHLVEREVSELKVIFPQADLDPENIPAIAMIYSLQPMDIDDRRAVNTQLAIDYCMKHPHWRLSQQTHKWAGIR